MNFQPQESSRETASTSVAVAKDLLTDSDWRDGAMALRALRPTLDIEDFVSRRAQLQLDGYRFLGMISGEHVVSVASYTISPHATMGRELLVHDMATPREFQGKGFGTLLVKRLEEIAHLEKCGRIFVHTKNAQGFYVTNGFEEYSTGMIKRING